MLRTIAADTTLPPLLIRILTVPHIPERTGTPLGHGGISCLIATGRVDRREIEALVAAAAGAAAGVAAGAGAGVTDAATSAFGASDAVAMSMKLSARRRRSSTPSASRTSISDANARTRLNCGRARS